MFDHFSSMTFNDWLVTGIMMVAAGFLGYALGKIFNK
jgi:hypothetical protein